MKYIYFFIFFIGFSIIGIGQSCLPNGITFTTQGQIDSFSINYPGCRVIEGDVSFNYKNDISNLLGLSQIYKINGNFTLKSTNCINLEGLNNLTEVGGDFSIGEYYYYTYTGGYAPSVTSLKGLDALNIIGGRLSIIGTSIQDFKELKSIEQIGSLWVVANLNLLNFVGLEKIKKLDEFIVGLSGYVNDNSTFSVIGNESLQNFEGLSGLRSIHGKFNVIGNVDFYDFTGLSALKSIGSFKLSANNKMVNFSGLNNLDIINHDFVIGEVINTDYYHYHSDIPVGNELLVNFEGLKNLGKIGGVFKVVGENKLTNFAELLTLSNIGSLEIKSPSLLSLNGLQQITSIENVDIQQFNLESLSGLDNLDTIIGTLNLSNLGRLKSFDGLGRLKYIGEDFILKNVDSVTNFEGLNNLEYIDGDFLVGDVFIVPEIGPHTGPWENKREYQGNNSLINFQGLDKLKTINGVFQIAFNQNLTNLFGLEYLENINSLNIGYLRIHSYGWGLQFFGNDNLISVQALDNAIIKNNLFVFGNAKLENLNGIHLENCIEGSVEISGNSSLTDISSLLGVRNISGGLVLGGAIDNYTKAPGKKWNDDVYLGNMFTEITGLDSLESVGFMHIQGNENLKNINAFSKLKNIEKDSRILMNPKLSECNIGACESLNNVSIDFF